MASANGWLQQVRPRARAVRGGLHPVSALKMAVGVYDDVRLGGAQLEGENPRAVAATVVDVAGGEYAAPGFEIEAGHTVVDAGANVGAFAVLAALRGARVTAYEPHPDTFRHLRRNTATLGVSCVQAALVADAHGESSVSLSVDSADTGHRVGAPGRSVRVPAASLADAIGDGCDLLKLDVEGAEFELLTQAGDALLRRARLIACETHPWGGDAGAVVERVRDAGFEAGIRTKASGLAMVFARRL